MRQAFRRHRLVAVSFGQADQFDRIVHVGLQPLHRLDLSGQMIALAHHLLRGGGVIPQRRVLGAVIQFGEAALGGVPVKDASSAVPATA